MSTPKPPSTQKVPDLPKESPELVAKRDRMISELEKAAKEVPSGALQQVLRKMKDLLHNTKPNQPIDNGLYKDVKDAFTRYSSDTKSPAAPPILMESIEMLQEFITAMGFAPAGAPAPAATAPAAAPPAAGKSKGPSDAFESSSSSRAKVIGEVNPNTTNLDPRAEKSELESFKAWMKNPALGKLKG